MAKAKAYVLIEAAVGKTTEVVTALKSIAGVSSADPVTGPYDAIVIIEGADINAVGNLVTKKVHTVDGVLRTVDQIEVESGLAVINSIKAVSSMDISEKRRPQDGAFTAKTGEATASFRVASAGVLHGEKLSVRVLNQSAGTYTLQNVGLMEKQRAIIKDAIGKPSGMILMCGPTGSG